VFAAVQRAVRRAVVDLAQTPAMRAIRYDNLTGLPRWRPETPLQTPLDMHLESTGQYTRQRLVEAEDPTAIPTGLGTPAKPRTLPILRVVGQVGAAYIVAEGPSGLYLVDQHAAHERILYEQFMEQHARQDTIAQYTLTAQTIHLPPTEARLLDENLDILHVVGFELEPFGPNTFVIRSVPALLSDQSPEDVLLSILGDLERGHQPGQETIEAKIIKRVCKQAAVKAGQILSLNEMEALVRQLERCESPRTCPHGRPTMLHLTSEQLAREFGRLGS
jgi:DNA mismatch repair protein MutL